MTLREQIMEAIDAAVLQFEWGSDASSVTDAVLMAIAAGTQRAETGETPAPSEGCQSGGVAASPNTSHRSTGE